MTSTQERDAIESALAESNGILRLQPTWVARDMVPPGRRLGLHQSEYDVGERGWISERWLGSTTLADNRLGPEDEGLSYVALGESNRITLAEAIELAKPIILGKEYAKTHQGLGRLAKIFDVGDRIPFHFHQAARDAERVGRNPKEEAYYFPKGVDLGPHPETFFGVHPYIAEEGRHDLLLPYLQRWEDDLILRHSRAYLQVPGEGFHVPSGVLHAPGTALTIELQEDSDVAAILQAKVADQIVSKEMLFKDVCKEDREEHGERIILDQINWQACGDPYFYENRRTYPQLVTETQQEQGEEYWVFYNTSKFSGKKLVVEPGGRFLSIDHGVYNILVWQGQGVWGGHRIKAGDFHADELLVSHARAIEPLIVENSGREHLVVFKFFGPDINPDVPKLPTHHSRTAH